MAARCSSQRPAQARVSSGTTGAFPRRFPLHDFVPAMLLLSIGLAALLAAYLNGNDRNGQYLVITAPWAGYKQTLSAIRGADGGLAAIGGFSNIAIASSSRGDFPERAKQAGAWLVLPAPRISGCFGLQSEASRP